MESQFNLLARTKKFLSKIPQCNALKISAIHATKNQLITELPFSLSICGNPDTKIIHGGSIITLMDTTAGIAAFNSLEAFEVCSTIDLRVDYLRPAIPDKPVYAKAECYRTTDNILFIHCEAYQEEHTIAKCTANFVRLGNKATTSIDDLVITTPDNDVEIRIEAPSKTAPFVELAANADQNRTSLLNAIPYARFIGMNLIDDENDIYKLNPLFSNIGYPNLPAIHGGVIGGFMQLSAAMQLMSSRANTQLPKIIDFSLDYIRAGQHKDTFAQAVITRQGERFANVEVSAWQQDKNTPIALGRAHFLLV